MLNQSDKPYIKEGDIYVGVSGYTFLRKPPEIDPSGTPQICMDCSHRGELSLYHESNKNDEENDFYGDSCWAKEMWNFSGPGNHVCNFAAGHCRGKWKEETSYPIDSENLEYFLKLR